MKFDYLSVPLATLALVGSALALGAVTQPAHQTVTPPQDQVAAPVTATTCQEDQPCWNCLVMGDRICADPKGDNSYGAWKSWAQSAGATKLRVDPTRAFTVEYVGYASQTPKLAEYELAIPGTDGFWYVFRPQYSN